MMRAIFFQLVEAVTAQWELRILRRFVHDASPSKINNPFVNIVKIEINQPFFTQVPQREKCLN